MLNKTLDELGIEDWPNSNIKSSLIERCFALRKKPVNEFSVEDLRLLISQGLALKILVRVALEKLSENPLLSGYHYRGDLLLAVMSVPESFWAENNDLNNELVEILSDVEELFETIKNDITPLSSRFTYR